MDNNKLDAQLRRDTATHAGLLADQDNYKPLEDDIVPLRTERPASSWRGAFCASGRYHKDLRNSQKA